MTELRLTVNGVEHTIDVPQSRTLAEVLRYDLGLTGTKIGCNEAECGICTVHVDGTPVDSCVYPAFKANGRSILTIEGLANGDQLHPLQEAFIDHGAVQCGFCTAGLIMNAEALIERCPNPDDHDIKVALKDTYCRCTGYTSVINAIKSAAAKKRGEATLPVNEPEVIEPLNVVGHNEKIQDSIERVTGRAKYTDDYTFDGMLFARTLRSRYPHAKIISIDTSKAKALPGVRAVLTSKDVPGHNRHGLVHLDWPALADDKVRYMGDAVAIVAADSKAIADEALDLIDVEYEPLPVVADPVYAHQPDAPLVHDDWEGGNLLKHIKVRHGDIEQGFTEADVIVEHTYHTATTEHAFLEPECAIGVPAGYDADHAKLTIYVGSQIPYQDRSQIATCLNLPEEAIRVKGVLIGGGFGGKEDIAGQIHVALLATVTNRPVKMLYSRQESLLFHPKRHATVIRIKTGAKRDGHLTAVEAELYGDGGAYASLSDKVMTRATTHATGPYNVPHAKIDCYAMYTNNPPSGAFRGFGVTQSAFAVEQNMDMVAHELGIDPVEFRRINAQKVGVTTATGQLLRESVGLLDTLDLCERDMHGNLNGNFRWNWREGDLAYAWGIACAYKNTGLGGGAPDRSDAEVEAFEDGTVEVRTSSADMGQGLSTVLAQCAAEELGLPFGQVRVLLSDTDLTPNGGPTTASRQTYMSGNAVRIAAANLREMLTKVVAEELDCPPDRVRFEEGLARYEEMSTTPVKFGDVIKMAHQQGMNTKILQEYYGPKTQPLGTGGDMHFAFSYATQMALVSVDTTTGEVTVHKIISAADVGRAINPLQTQGQIEGGIIMALGNCLTEAFIVEDGVPWSTLLARYKMPSIKHTPEIISHLVEHKTADGPYGAKGVGELPSINTTPAIANAIYNAVGVRVFRLPVDQDALYRAMVGGETEVDTAWQDVK
ncbi:MAG TPA: molybdopterin cofactor-binding domain-containing protein [Phototrophicaceae bacterium]|nr:molybdopterin cofactor-binding domain-containing protein [Phototrophicaceae bacterium]